jgi:hypothetical protein
MRAAKIDVPEATIIAALILKRDAVIVEAPRGANGWTIRWRYPNGREASTVITDGHVARRRAKGRR